MNKANKVTLNRIIGLVVTCVLAYPFTEGLGANPWHGVLVGFYSYIVGLAYADHNPRT
jgi:hypothetical protein